MLLLLNIVWFDALVCFKGSLMNTMIFWMGVTGWLLTNTIRDSLTVCSINCMITGDDSTVYQVFLLIHGRKTFRTVFLLN